MWVSTVPDKFGKQIFLGTLSPARKCNGYTSTTVCTVFTARLQSNSVKTIVVCHVGK